MKKLFYGAALLCAVLSFSSCGNTEMCYKVTTTYELAGKEYSSSSYVWITKNQIKDKEAEAKEFLTAMGIDEDIIKVTSVPTLNSDCEE